MDISLAWYIVIYLSQEACRMTNEESLDTIPIKSNKEKDAWFYLYYLT